tara:strand:+ start:7376 stop:8488 length:1113 start_codon:yes stop_codon:yes gene_type:complete
MTPLEVGVWYSLPGIPNVVISLQKTSDFLAYPEWITQRNTKQRATKKSVIDHLRKLFPTHHIVGLGKLTQDDEWEDGTKYSAGTIWRLDANTRSYLWEAGKTDRTPENVLCVMYLEDSLIKLRRTYWTFDNPTAAEVAAEVVTGCQKSLGMNLKTKKFQEGQYVTALSYLCQYDDPDNYGIKGLWTETNDDTITQSEYRRTKMQNAIMQYKDEIIAVDNLLNQTGINKHFDQTFITSLFLLHTRRGTFHDNIELMMKLINEKVEDEYGDVVPISMSTKGRLNATGWIQRENKQPAFGGTVYIPDRGKMDGFAQGVPFFTYWLDVAVEEGLHHKQNQGAKIGYQKWFQEFLARPRFKQMKEQVLTTGILNY